jgi:hypothetical protein
MTFEEVLDQAIAMLQRRGRPTYRTVQLQFQLDEAHLEALQDELIYGQRLAIDKEVSMSVHKVLILGGIGHAIDYANVWRWWQSA